jgi:hypothetical protein
MRKSLVFELRARNVDVLTALEAGIINREDEEHLAVATVAGRALYTFNVAIITPSTKAGFRENALTRESSSLRSSVTLPAKRFAASCG